LAVAAEFYASAENQSKKKFGQAEFSIFDDIFSRLDTMHECVRQSVPLSVTFVYCCIYMAEEDFA